MPEQHCQGTVDAFSCVRDFPSVTSVASKAPEVASLKLPLLAYAKPSGSGQAVVDESGANGTIKAPIAHPLALGRDFRLCAGAQLPSGVGLSELSTVVRLFKTEGHRIHVPENIQRHFHRAASSVDSVTRNRDHYGHLPTAFIYSTAKPRGAISPRRTSTTEQRFVLTYDRHHSRRPAPSARSRCVPGVSKSRIV